MPTIAESSVPVDNTGARVLAPRRRPARRIAPDCVVRPLEPFTRQQIVDPRHPQPITPVPPFVLDQQLVQPLLKRTDPR